MNKLQIYWENICKIYFLTKHYLLLAEELSEDFDTFLQPLKEHRDAFDHIARVYGYNMLNREITNIDNYQQENMRKAIGHTYRAFFDTADWLSYTLRKKIRETISTHTKDEIVSKFSSYESAKAFLKDVPEKIANIRSNKDLSDDESVLAKEVEEYSKLLDELLELYGKIYDAFV